MISQFYADQCFRIEIDDMRLMPHPAKEDDITFKHGMLRGIAKYLPPSEEVWKEALAELDALKSDAPAKRRKECEVKQCERRVVEVAVEGR